jgi:predicted AlkP superfamily phosphohydrolase/phosphomutase
MNAFLRDLNDTLEARVRAYRALWQKESWDLFFLVFTGTDRLGHFLFEAFENERHTHRGAFVDYFRKIDAAIGEIYERCDKDDLFIMLSDHGFGVIDREVNVNYFLREKGLLKVVDPQPDSFNAVESDSKVFALDPARIYVHRKGKFPRGNVKPEDEEKVIEDVIAALKDLTVDGKPVARRIVRREEIYSGPFIADAPDIVIIPAGGFDLKARLVARELTAKGIFTGKHTQDDAFLFMRAPGLAENDIPATPWVGDLRTIVERYS